MGKIIVCVFKFLERKWEGKRFWIELY